MYYTFATAFSWAVRSLSLALSKRGSINLGQRKVELLILISSSVMSHKSIMKLSLSSETLTSSRRRISVIDWAYADK